MVAPAAPDDRVLDRKALASHFKVQIIPVIGSRKLNAVTPTVEEEFLDRRRAA
ncbi:hypothetical protein ABZ590_10825 [Streptomyces hirsutus]|uniref:hypothetical protein n=1 Tax=Streptomyces hirsutus TaxID=35620 RepID=UPI0033DA202A